MHHAVIVMYRYENSTGRKHSTKAVQGDYFQSMIYKRSIMYAVTDLISYIHHFSVESNWPWLECMQF